MKILNAVLALAVTAAISSNAAAQSGPLRPLNAAAASQISGSGSSGSTPLSPMSTTVVRPTPAPAVQPQPLRPMQAQTTASALQPMLSSQPVKPLYPETASGAAFQSASPIAKTTSLPSGSRLSTALERYVRERGWDIRWQIDEDYVLDADLPIPTNDLIEAVTWVVHTYQSQRGMVGVVPRFTRSNRVVVIEKMDVRDTY